MRWCCIVCPHTAARRSRRRSLRHMRMRSLKKRKTDCTRRRQCCVKSCNKAEGEHMNKKVYLTLENGKVFEGYSVVTVREFLGDRAFPPGMRGYIETLTDPIYYGQIVTQTFPLTGNSGVIPADMESRKCWLTAYVVREKCDT